MKKLSIIICSYNEQDNVLPLADEIISSLRNIDFEVIFVDDGSTDNTRDQFRKITDNRFTMVELKRNYGQSSALQAGIDFAQGKYIALIDGDLQNDPADIPFMLEKIEIEKLDMVAGVRSNRKDGVFMRKIPSKIANYIIRKSTATEMNDLGCTLKIFTSEAIKSIHIYGELHRFIPVLLALEGFTKFSQVDVNHRQRKFGHSKYNISRTGRVIGDLLLMLFFKKYMQRPMHLFSQLGITIFGIGLIINLYLLVIKLMGHNIWGKPLLLLGTLLVLGGLQFITTGIIAEILMRTYFEGQGKKPYRINKIVKND